MKISDTMTSLVTQRSMVSREDYDSGSVRSSSTSTSDGIRNSNKTDASIRSVDPSVNVSESSPGNKKDLDKHLDDAINQANQFFQNDNRSLQFARDKDTDKIVVIIKDVKTDKVIRQIPSELMLKLSKQLEQVKGMLFEDKA